MDPDAAGQFLNRGFQLHGRHRLADDFRGILTHNMDTQDFTVTFIRDDLYSPVDLVVSHGQPVDGIWDRGTTASP